MSKWYSLHIKNEILLWFFIVSVLPLLFISIVYFIHLKSDFEEQTKKFLTQVLNEKVEITSNYIDSLQDKAETIASLPRTKEFTQVFKKDFAHNKLNNIKMSNSFFDELVEKAGYYDLFVMDLDGNIVYTVKKESDLYENLISGSLNTSGLALVFNKSKLLLNTQMITFSHYSPSNAKASFIATPILEENKVIGIIAIQISDKKLFDMIINYDGLGESGEIVAGYYDKDKNILSAIPLRFSPNAFQNDLMLQSKNQIKNLIPVSSAILGNSGVGKSVDYRDIKILAAWKYVPILNWGMVVKIDYEEVMKPVYDRLLANILTLFFVILLIIFAIILATKHIIDPVQNLITRVNNLSKGEAQATEAEEINLENEIGVLSKSFDKMSKSLYDSQETIRNYAMELESRVEARTQELEASQKNLQETNKKMKNHFDIIDKHVITSSTDLDGLITEVSEAFCLISGYSKAELIGKKHSILKHPDFDNSVYEELWRNIINRKNWSGEIKNQRKDGSYYWVYAIVAPSFDNDGKVNGYTSIRQDITNKKRVEELSVTDQLTKIYNRLHLDNSFKQEVNRAKRYNAIFSVILLDIDYFKAVNDNFGHDTGDEVLVDVVNILKQHVRATDILGRWGGEEFLIILPQTEMDKAEHLAEKLRSEIESHIFKKIGHKTCSFGISQFKPEDEDAKEVVKRADNALYAAKNGGRNRVVVSQE